MPTVTAPSRLNNDGQRVTNFVDSVGTTSTTYTYAATQDELKIINNGNATLTVTVNGITYTASPFNSVTVSVQLNSFAIVSSSGTQGFAANSYNREPASAKKLITQTTSFGQVLNGALTSGTIVGKTYRFKYMSNGFVSNPQLVYANSFLDVTWADQKNSVPITIKASIEKNGVIYPCWFNGQKQIILDPGSLVKTDISGISISPNETFYVRTWVSVPVDTNNHPAGTVAVGSGIGDLTESGTITDADVYAYHPVCIIGETEQVSIVGIGDSIMDGTGDNSFTYDGKSIYKRGFFTRAFIGKKSFVNVSQPGQKISHVINPAAFWARHKMVGYSTHALCELGVNDLSATDTLDTVKANLTTLWTMLYNMGIKVYQSTITPITTSTDAWATVANQTARTTNSFNSKRVDLNDWIRTVPYPLSGFIDIADIVEPSRNDGRWKASMTSDGTHPNEAGHTLIASYINLSLFN